MYIEFKHFPVNWADGMKVSSKDFIAQENAFQDALRDVRCLALNEFCYGLLPTSNLEVDRYPKLQFNMAQSTLILHECRAITPGGHRIEISEQTFQGNAFPAHLPSVAINPQQYGIYEVFLVVHTFDRVGAGRYAEDIPPRHTITAPNYEMTLQLKGESRMGIGGPNIIKISEVELKDGRLAAILSETGDYIPPCISINAHRRLENAHQSFGQLINTILEHARTILRDVSPHGDTNQEAKEVTQVAEKVAGFLISSVSFFTFQLPQMAPIHLVSYIQDLARYVNFAVELSIRGTLVKKFYDQFKLGHVFETLVNSRPDHANLYPTLMQINAFLTETERFFSALRQHQYRTVYVDITDVNKRTQLPIQPTPLPPPPVMPYDPSPVSPPYQQPAAPPSPPPGTTRPF